MRCLNIYLHSFQLSNDLIKPNDKVRVSITTFPEKNKQAFIVNAKNNSNIDHIFSVNISEQTTKVLFVFRKKNFILNDPIVSSTMIYLKDLPALSSNSYNTDPIFINLYENLHNQPNKNFSERRIIGLMKLHFSITDDALERSNQTNKNTKEFSKLNIFNFNNENYNQNKQDMIFSIMLVEEN